MEDRLSYADSLMDEIHDSAKNPMKVYFPNAVYGLYLLGDFFGCSTEKMSYHIYRMIPIFKNMCIC